MRSILRFGTLAVAAATAVSCAPSAPPRPAPTPGPRGDAQAAAPAPGGAPAAGAAAGAGAGTGAGAAGAAPRRPRPYAQVITPRAVTDTGAVTVHRVDDKWMFELPDSLMGRSFLLVGRVAAVPANFGGFLPAGTSVQERLVRWERQADRVVLRAVDVDAVADDSLPIARSVASNYLGAILAAFPVQAYGRDSSAVVDVTEFFGGDTPALSGLSTAQREQYRVRRLDPARSFINTARSYPLNVEVRHTQTFEAAAPPSDR
ncbi:MAG TPA: DUF5117 domain-containing protein, partial [Longimicrobium sp.]